ncbi:MAG: PBP1A family penicillin-binding protein, partial [Rickettsiales bacterium]|nr:PBP1A family penicillin-binding protein [Rickettsiales bacterium]
STITQQVAKNMLLSRERTLTRKIKEAILSFRMSHAFSKDRIMELYLNEIYLGAGSYGVAAASLNYFNKSVDELNLQEAALLASLPKAPSTYDPRRNYEKALTRRNWVLGGMAEEGYITQEEATKAQQSPIELKDRTYADKARSEYFTEEIRRLLVDLYGQEVAYQGGLSVHSTLDLRLQAIAERVFREGLASYERKLGYRGPLHKLENLERWQQALATIDKPSGTDSWKLAVVLGKTTEGYQIGLPSGDKGIVTYKDTAWARRGSNGKWSAKDKILNERDVILVAATDDAPDHYGLRQVPKVNGALVAMDPHNGRVLAMVGGSDYATSQFNRATQAKRQPGSAFKPFVYLTALEKDYTPASLIADEPIEFTMPKRKNKAEEEGEEGKGQEELLPWQQEEEDTWAPQNYSGNFYGPTTLRRGVEKSLNVMTVHLGLLLGTDTIAKTAEKLGIPINTSSYLASVLGTTETTLMALTNAYAMLVNGGKRITPSLVERIQDRHGTTLYTRDIRPCESCRLTDNSLAEQLVPPTIPDTREQVVDPRNAYQMVSILEGVVQRGTGRAAQKLGRPGAGKTGTTNDSMDAWFIGFTPDLVVGTYVGYDTPRSLGKKAEGATIALPIFNDFMEEALKNEPPVPFRIPPGIRLVKIDAKTGFLPTDETPRNEIIQEAFLPGTEPTQSIARSRPLPVINAGITYPNAPAVLDENMETPTFRGTGGIY